MEKNKMIKYAVRDMIESNPDTLAERLSVILSIDDCSRLCNGFVYGIKVKDLDAFAKKHDLSDGKVVINNIEVCEDTFVMYCTFSYTDKNGNGREMEKRIIESFDGIDEDVYDIIRL